MTLMATLEQVCPINLSSCYMGRLRHASLLIPLCPGKGSCWYGDDSQHCRDNQIYVGKCINDERQWFTFVDLGNSSGVDEVLIQTGDGTRCFERFEREIYLEDCDVDSNSQKWYALNGTFDGPRFEIAQLTFTPNQCITNDHRKYIPFRSL
jgi:hypothetical protein